MYSIQIIIFHAPISNKLFLVRLTAAMVAELASRTSSKHAHLYNMLHHAGEFSFFMATAVQLTEITDELHHKP